jgi:hypothetical protein
MSKFGKLSSAMRLISRGVTTGEAWHAAWSIAKPTLLPLFAAAAVGWRALTDGLSWPVVCAVVAAIFASGLLMVRFVQEARTHLPQTRARPDAAASPEQLDRSSRDKTGTDAANSKELQEITSRLKFLEQNFGEIYKNAELGRSAFTILESRSALRWISELERQLTERALSNKTFLASNVAKDAMNPSEIVT